MERNILSYVRRRNRIRCRGDAIVGSSGTIVFSHLRLSYTRMGLAFSVGETGFSSKLETNEIKRDGHLHNLKWHAWRIEHIVLFIQPEEEEQLV